jgi:hypothetical protein
MLPVHSPDDRPRQGSDHSQAEPHEPTGADARLSAPSAQRNAPHIVAALAGHLPGTGTVLEIAAGTGEHAVALARANPGLTWQPTEIAPERRASIDAWAGAEGLANIRPAVPLDAAAPDWRVEPVDVVYLSNLLHLIAEEAARNVIAGAARAPRARRAVLPLRPLPRARRLPLRRRHPVRRKAASCRS